MSAEDPEQARSLERDWILAADLGNSRAKWTGFRTPYSVGDRPVLRLTLDYDGAWDGESLSERLAEHGFGAPARAGCISVAGAPPLDRAREGIAESGCNDVRTGSGGTLDHGLEIDCRNVHTIGDDRLFAAAGAALRMRRSAVVLDAGTALTVDAVEVREGEPARFLGGAIAPGPELLVSSLGSAGAQLFEVDLEPGVPALGKESAEALRAGCVVGFRGAAFELARRVGLESGLAAAPRVVCGGAARFLLEPEPFWTGDLVHEPDLVAHGIAAALTRVATDRERPAANGEG